MKWRIGIALVVVLTVCAAVFPALYFSDSAPWWVVARAAAATFILTIAGPFMGGLRGLSNSDREQPALVVASTVHPPSPAGGTCRVLPKCPLGRFIPNHTYPALH